MKEDEKKHTEWELSDTKPPVIRSEMTRKAK